jgi:3'(2'), 5'-bisphosphate nucleotidase
MSSPPYTQERLIAELAVQLTSLLTKQALQSVKSHPDFNTNTKPDDTPVTIVDFAAQALLTSAVHAVFPQDQFIGEENANALRDAAELRQRVWGLVSSVHLDDEESDALLARPASIEAMLDAIDAGGSGQGGRKGRIWMMDPLDGTAAFLKGQQYAVSLALVENGLERVGVVGCPNLPLGTARIEEEVVDGDGYGVMLSAVRGRGTLMRPMGTGALRDATELLVLRDGPEDLRVLHIVDSSKGNVWRQQRLRDIAAHVGTVYPGTDLWSSHMRYVALVLGGGDIQLRIPGGPQPSHMYVWDHAGLQLILTEAGCVVTDLSGRAIDFGAGRELALNNGVVAAMRRVHGRMLEILDKIL